LRRKARDDRDHVDHLAVDVTGSVARDRESARMAHEPELEQAMPVGLRVNRDTSSASTAPTRPCATPSASR
jgi:hypothetical protein